MKSCEYYIVGKKYAKLLSTKLELHLIGRELDISDEAVRKISFIALGKVMVGLKSNLGEAI